MSDTIQSGLAMVKVLKDWGVEHLYGIPGGSFNSTMDALYQSRDSIRFIQVRHEETGAIAASVDAKLSGRVGVCSGTAGPGATHLFNGLYDAKMDHVPVLALVGQVPSTSMNHDAFQEMNENPMFADVAVYNRTVMNPESLPHVVDEAIRRAHAERGVAVVTVPVDYGLAEIPDLPVSTAANRRNSLCIPDPADVAEAVRLLEAAERPVLYLGQGARGAGTEALALSEHFSLPVVLSVLAKGIIPDNAQNLLGTAARLATKPANEALAETDCILFIGSDFPFAKQYFSPSATFIQVDADPAKLGRRRPADVAMLGDAGETMRQMLYIGLKRPVGRWLEANRKNRRNWLDWLRGFEERSDSPLRVEPVFREINRIATDDAVFVTDVGNTTTHAVRLLDMTPGQRFTTSGWFATMGYGVPGGIAAKLSYPERQVFTLCGDGAFAMGMQDIITQVKYKLPIINVVFSNRSLGFIEAEQEDTPQPRFGVDLMDADFAAAARAMGAQGHTVTGREQLRAVFDQAAGCAEPVVIDVKLGNRRPFPTEAMELDPDVYGREAVEAFKARYEVRGMPLLRELL